jgi:hypothetical protein
MVPKLSPTIAPVLAPPVTAPVTEHPRIEPSFSDAIAPTSPVEEMFALSKFKWVFWKSSG